MSTDTDTALARLRPVPTPGRIGQGTAVEQSRAVAEVQAQVIVAQQMPRDIGRAVREMQRSCAMKSLAEKAFYRYSRGGQQISGPTVQLARELARAFGNVQYGITELRRDDVHGQSEMLAFAWDLETNTRSATTFIVQHVRDTRDGSRALTDQRDIYELNANSGARRLREMIFAILPGWYTEDAVTACHATLAGDTSDGNTLAERAAVAAGRFAGIGVTAAQLEQKMGAPQSRWSAADLAQLAVIWRSIERRETTKEDEFGAARATVTAADIISAPKTASPADGSPPSAGSPATPPAATAGEAPTERKRTAMATNNDVAIIQARFKDLGYKNTPGDRAARLRATGRLAGHEGELSSTRQLTRQQVARVLDRLKDVNDGTGLQARLDELAQEAAEAQGAEADRDGD